MINKLKNTFYYFLPNLISIFIGLFSIPVIMRKFSPEEYAVISISDISGILLLPVLFLSLEQGVQRFYYESKDSKKFTGELVFLAFINSLVTFPLVIAFYYIFRESLFPVVNNFIYIILSGLYNYFQSFSRIFINILRMENKVKSFAFVVGSRPVLFMVFLLFFADLFSIKGYFFSHLLASLFMLIFSFIFSFEYFNLEPKNVVGIFKRNIFVVKYSIHLIIPSLISSFMLTIDRFVLQYFISSRTLGIYSIGIKIGNILASLASALKSQFIPYYYKTILGNNNKEKLIYRTEMFILLYNMLAIFVILFIDNLIYLLNQTDYYSIIKFIPLILANILIYNIPAFISNGYLVKNKSYLSLVFSSFIIVIFLSLLLIVSVYWNISIMTVLYLKLISVFYFLIHSSIVSFKYVKIKYHYKFIIFQNLLLYIITVFLSIYYVNNYLVDFVWLGIMSLYLLFSYFYRYKEYI